MSPFVLAGWWAATMFPIVSYTICWNAQCSLSWDWRPWSWDMQAVFFCNCQEKRRYTTKKPEAPQEKKSWSLHLQAPDQRDSVESWACRPRKSEGLTEDGEGEKRNEAKRWNLFLVDTRVLRKRGVTACLWKATGIRNTWYCTYAQIFWRDPPKLGLILMLSYQHPSAGFHVPKKNCKKCSVASWLFVAPCGVLLLPDLRAHEAH